MKMMFQGPKGYIVQICTPAVWKQYNIMAVLHFFLVNSPLTYILFSMGPHPLLYAKLKWVLPAFPTPSQSQAENRKYYISNQFQNLKY